MNLKTCLLLSSLLFAVPALAGQDKVVQRGNSVKASATIVQIDATTRQIVFKDDEGKEDSVFAGPEIQRFNELKVGDKVTLTYYESTVFQLKKAGSTSKMDADSASIASGGGKLPGGTMATQSRMTVTVKSVDMSIPSITVTTSDGRTISRKVEKKSDLEGVKAGDKIEITTTQALLASVERK